MAGNPAMAAVEGFAVCFNYLSAYLERHNDAYRDHLLQVSRAAAWTDWIRFFAEGVAEQAIDGVQRARQLLALQKKYREQMQGKSHSSLVLRLVDELFASPVITMFRPSMCHQYAVSIGGLTWVEGVQACR